MFLIFKQLKIHYFQRRYLYGVHHNTKRQIFYVKLKNNERAILLYKKDDNILDVRSINVPEQYERQGIARLLAEAAFTYAIIHNYFLILTCPYMQKYYNAIKTPELEAHVIGPSHILNSF